jgi:Taurine catabolism dioxygenase TauD, TfdA family
VIPEEISRFFAAEEIQGARWAAGAPLLLTARRGWPGDPGPELGAALRKVTEQRSAVLLRGTGTMTAAACAELARAVFNGLPAYQTGEHPPADGAAGLYRPVLFAPEERLLWHHEDSFRASWPQFIMFACAVPAASGGQTTLVDSCRVHDLVPDEVAAPLREHGIRYQRACDGMAGRRWQDIYGTDSPAEALRRAARNGEALVLDGARASIRAVRPAFLGTGRGTSWFNQVVHWHPRALPAELRDMVTAGVLPAYRTCAAGNGQPIPDSHVDQIIDAHQSAEYSLTWQAGDVLLLDNRAVSHGRAPYRGRREHFVRMAGTGTWATAGTARS